MTFSLRVLLVEDDKIDQMAFERFIHQQNLPYRYLIASSLHEARQTIAAEDFDIIISDYLLGDGTAFDIFALQNKCPVIVTTGSGDEEIAAKAMKSGAYDYLIKDPEGNYLKVLPVTIENTLKRKHNEDELEKYHSRLEELVKERSQALLEEVTKHKKTLTELRESEKLFRQAFDNALTGMLLVDPQGIILESNNAFTSMLGYSGSELEGKRIFDITYPDDKEITEKFIHEAINLGKHGGVFDKRYLHKEGQVVWSRVSTSLVKSSEDKPLYFVSQIQDITEQKKLAKEKEKLEEQLRHAQKMEAIGTLAGGIAHDFNNILVPIIGYSEMIIEDLPAGSQHQKDLQEVLRAASRAKDLIKQILTFSRQSDYQAKTLYLAPLVKESIKLLSASLPSNIIIRQDMSAVTGKIIGDPTNINQIIMNLCTNAYHAMRERGGILTISLADVNLPKDIIAPVSSVPAGNYLLLSISDTGQGMSRSVMEHIFEPYYTTKKLGEGTGLGLAIVHGIVSSYGGKVLVSSTPGKGSTFDVYLPMLEDLEADPDAEHFVDHISPRGTERILLVDDEENVLQTTHRLLEKLGYGVSAFTSSIDALHSFKTNPHHFDLIITDMTMPDMTGDQLAVHLLRIRPDIPVILCTGFSSIVDESAAKEIGICDFIMKPVLSHDIAQRIRKILDDVDITP